MATNREQLITESAELDIPRRPEGTAYLLIDEQATAMQEYFHGALPTYLQTPAVTRAYVETYMGAEATPQRIGFALDARRIFERDARRRCDKGNKLFVSQYSLELTSIAFVENGIAQRRKLGLSHLQRQEQLARIATKASDPHIELRVVPDHEERPWFENAIHFSLPNDNAVVFHEEGDGLVGPVADPEEVARFEEGFAHLARVALDPHESLTYVEAVIRRNSASVVNYS